MKTTAAKAYDLNFAEAEEGMVNIHSQLCLSQFTIEASVIPYASPLANSSLNNWKSDRRTDVKSPKHRQKTKQNSLAVWNGLKMKIVAQIKH